jgi:autotransporter strand-loop-strand O-heptosyltransferase
LTEQGSGRFGKQAIFSDGHTHVADGRSPPAAPSLPDVTLGEATRQDLQNRIYPRFINESQSCLRELTLLITSCNKLLIEWSERNYPFIVNRGLLDLHFRFGQSGYRICSSSREMGRVHVVGGLGQEGSLAQPNIPIVSEEIKRLPTAESSSLSFLALEPTSCPVIASAPESNGSPSAAAAVSAEVSAAASAAPKRAYPPPSESPTQEGPDGLRFDFNDGCRVALPPREHPWHVRISDLDTGNILFETQIAAGRVNSTKRYFVRFRLEISQNGKDVLAHDYSAKDRDVLIQFPVGTIGDTIGWFSYAVKFQERHRCRLICGIGEKLIPLFRNAYPDIEFATHEEIKPERYYATYSMGLFFDDKDCVHQPCDFRHVGLHRTAGYILNVDPTEVAPRIKLDDDSRPIPEPYVCIAVQSSTQCKYWNNPTGWREIVRFIRDAGYRVVCIDQKPTHGTGLVWNHIPNGAEDETGERSLQERARWLKHAEFFVGLSSGLSWLAWAVGTPVVMISGFTHPLNEFATPYRVINYHTCNSCWNDPRHRFDHHDFLWCPRHKDTPRQFECTRLVTADQVKLILQSIPGFGTRDQMPSRSA